MHCERHGERRSGDRARRISMRRGRPREWFADAKGYPTQWEQIFRFPQIVGVLLALAVTIVLAVVWRRTGGRALLPGPEAFGATPGGRARFYALVPLILGIHVGVPLIVLGITGQLFSPNNPLSGPWLYVLTA